MWTITGWVENTPPNNNTIFFAFPFENIRIGLTVDEINRVMKGETIYKVQGERLIIFSSTPQSKYLYIAIKNNKYSVEKNALNILINTRYRDIKPIYIM